eukprot:gene8523-8338_t
MTSSETRDIILDVTEKLIYRHGIAATGMDLLVKTAGVSRKSIYRYFANKDELVIAALQRRDERWLQWLRSEVEQYAGSGARLLGVFSALKTWFGSADFRGCAFINTSGETGNPQDPVRLLAKAHKQKLFEYLLELCEAHGTPAPEQQAAQLLILVDGAITIALIMGDQSAIEKIRLAEDGWNSRDPQRVSLAYTLDTQWRNRAEFAHNREQAKDFLTRKWARELDYRLIKELWAFTGNRIAVRYAYEWHDDSGNWFRSYGNENWEFDQDGLMSNRHACINDMPIKESERKFHWPLGRRPDDHPGLSELGL